MFQAKDKTIGNHTYRVTQLPLGQGKRVLIKIMKILGPSLVSLMESVGEGGDTPTILDANMASVGDAVSLFLDRLNEEDLNDLCATFGQYTVLVSGDKQVPLNLELQEIHFSGKYLELFKWLAFCIEWNYSDFFASSKIVTAAVSGLKPKVSNPDMSE